MSIPAATTSRATMSIHVIDGDYCYAGGVNENAVITGGVILASPVINCSSVGSIANSPDYGYILSGPYGTPDPVQMGTNVAAGILAANTANKPCVVAINCLMRQTLNINAIALGYDTEPSTTDLFNLIKSGTHSASAIAAKARINLMTPTLVAALGATRPTAWYSNDEDLPVYDVCFNTPGADGVALQAMYAALLADTTMQARIAAVRAEGADTDNHALDAIIAARCYAESLWMLDALPTVPLAYYFRGKVAIPRYGFRYLGGSVAQVGVTEATIGCWAYQSNGTAGETTDLIEDLAVQGTVTQMPVLDVRTGGDAGQLTTLATRLNACRDRGINDVLLFINQGEAGAGADLTSASAILAAAQGARMSVPVIQSASLSLWGVGDGTVRLTTEWSVPVDFNAGSNPVDITAWHYGYKRNLFTTTPPEGDGTTTMVFYVDQQDNGPNAPSVSFVSGVVTATTGSEPNDTIAEFPSTLTGIVSAVFDEGALTFTLTLSEDFEDSGGDFSFCLTSNGVEYSNHGFTRTADNVLIYVMETPNPSGNTAAEGTFSAGGGRFQQTTGSFLTNIPISNYPITVIPAVSIARNLLLLMS